MLRDRKPRVDLRGEVFGKLTAVEWVGGSRWQCQCECGRIAHVLTANLRRGNSTSCGCIRNIAASKRATTHGLSGTIAYKSWLNIRRRCHEQSHPSYRDYGARGIEVCAEWRNDPVAFCAYVGEPPTLGHTLDRIDNKRGYEPGNIRWADRFEQANNRGNCRPVVFRGVRYSSLAVLARAIAEECGLLPESVINAIKDVAKLGRRSTKRMSEEGGFLS